MSREALEARASALIEGARTRGLIKRLAVELDRDEDLKRAVLEIGRERGAMLPEEALRWPSAKLLRRARAREEPSQQRSNPIRRDEGFDCAHCGRSVPPLGVTSRDHCPYCLRSLHVDVVPGDRSNPCGGLLDPVGGELVAGRAILFYRCRRCQGEHRVKAAVDGEAPDDWGMVVRTLACDPPP